jgi:hypothetical protein
MCADQWHGDLCVRNRAAHYLGGLYRALVVWQQQDSCCIWSIGMLLDRLTDRGRKGC